MRGMIFYEAYRLLIGGKAAFYDYLCLLIDSAAAPKSVASCLGVANFASPFGRFARRAKHIRDLNW